MILRSDPDLISDVHEHEQKKQDSGVEEENPFMASRTLKKVIKICESSGRGIYKRIDENRELLEFLQQEAPELLDRCPWINGWIAANDQFFVKLSEAVNVENIFDQEKYGYFRQYPRPWPGRK